MALNDDFLPLTRSSTNGHNSSSRRGSRAGELAFQISRRPCRRWSNDWTTVKHLKLRKWVPLPRDDELADSKIVDPESGEPPRKKQKPTDDSIDE